MRAAVVDLATNVVVNIIVADASSDPPPEDCILIDVENMICNIGWVFDPIMIDFVPPPEPIEEPQNGI